MISRLIAAALLCACGAASATQTPVVTNVRFGAHPGFDRMVIDVKGTHLPQVVVTRPYSLRQDGSGLPTSLRGVANIQVSLRGADAHPGYRGPSRVSDLRMRYLHGFQKLGDFEAVVTLGLTTDVRSPTIRVMRLTNPLRIVVDVSR